VTFSVLLLSLWLMLRWSSRYRVACLNRNCDELLWASRLLQIAVRSKRFRHGLRLVSNVRTRLAAADKAQGGLLGPPRRPIDMGLGIAADGDAAVADGGALIQGLSLLFTTIPLLLRQVLL